MRPVTAGDMRERVRVEYLVSGAWTLLAVLYASVLPGGTATAQPIAPELTTPPSVAYQVRVRYRTDVTTGMRIRWGDRVLAIDTVVDPDSRRRELLIQAGTVPTAAEYHAAALAQITREGAAITFSKDSVAGYDQATDTIAEPPASTATVTGVAKRIPGGVPQHYAGQTMVEAETVKLFVVPGTIDTLPSQGATCTWAGEEWAVRSLEPVAMNGTAIGAFVTVER